MTKGDLMKLVLSEDEQGYCDTAIPMHLWEGIDTSLHCFDCRNWVLINLAKRVIDKGLIESLLLDGKISIEQRMNFIKSTKKSEISNGHTFSEYGG